MTTTTTTATTASTTPSTTGAAPPPQPALLELWGHYPAVFPHARGPPARLAGPARMADEVAFLPAALSLQDTPVHPAPRRLAWLLMALFIIALVWSILGQVDIVAIAPGRIIVSDRTKVIQPLEASVVKAVLVKDGDRVKAGQVLVELDTTIASADKASVQEQARAAYSEVLRTQALLQLLSKKKLPAQAPPTQTSPTQEPPTLEPDVAAQLATEWQDISAKLLRLDATLQLRQAEIGTVQQTIAKLEATLPMAQQREVDYKRLVDQGYISGHATQDKTRERVELERDLATQRARLAEAQANATQTAQEKPPTSLKPAACCKTATPKPAPNTASWALTPPKPPSAKVKPSSRPR